MFGAVEGAAPLMGGKEGTRELGAVPGAEELAELPHIWGGGGEQEWVGVVKDTS